MALPAASHEATFYQSAHPDVKVLANSADIQMIGLDKEGLVMANFYAAGSAEGYTVSGPCTLAAHRVNGTLTFSVADPSRTQASVRVTVPGSWSKLVSADEGTILSGPSTIEVQLDGHGHQKNLTLDT